MIFLLGMFWGFVESYLFVFLKELEAPNYLLGNTISHSQSVNVEINFWFILRAHAHRWIYCGDAVSLGLGKNCCKVRKSEFDHWCLSHVLCSILWILLSPVKSKSIWVVTIMHFV